MIQFVYETNPVPLFRKLNVILQEHKEELCLYPGAELNPDWNAYRKLFEKGVLAVVTARRNNEIVGYTVNFISRHLHYSFLYGVNDIIYMHPEYRGYGIKLIKTTERLLKDKGVEFFSMSIKPHVDFRRVLEKLGYHLLEYQYFRRL